MSIYNDFKFICVPLATKTGFIPLTKPTESLTYTRSSESGRFTKTNYETLSDDTMSLDYDFDMSTNITGNVTILNQLDYSTDLNNAVWDIPTGDVLTLTSLDFSVLDDDAFNIEVPVQSPIPFKGIKQSLTPNEGVNTFSVYAKSDNWDFIWLAVETTANVDICSVKFNLLNGTVDYDVDINGFVATITPTLNGSFRCSLTFESLDDVNVILDPSDTTGGSWASVGNQNTIWVSSPQVNDGSVVTPYTATVSDDLYLDENFSLYTQDTCSSILLGGVVDYEYNSGTASGGSSSVFGMTNVGVVGSPGGNAESYQVTSDGNNTLRGVRYSIGGSNNTTLEFQSIVNIDGFSRLKVAYVNISNLTLKPSYLDFDTYGHNVMADFDFDNDKIYTQGGISAEMHHISLGWFRIIVRKSVITKSDDDGIFMIPCNDGGGIVNGVGTSKLNVYRTNITTGGISKGMFYEENKVPDVLDIDDCIVKKYLGSNVGTVYLEVKDFNGEDVLFKFKNSSGGDLFFLVANINGTVTLRDDVNSIDIVTTGGRNFNIAFSYDGSSMIYSVDGVGGTYTFTSPIEIDRVVTDLVNSEIHLNNIMLDDSSNNATYLNSLTS